MQQFCRTTPPVTDLSAVIEENPVSDWPAYVQPLVGQFGQRRVWDAFLAVHGFPATWCRGAGEAFAVEKFLKAAASQPA